MNWEAIGAIGEAVGAVVVVASLVYLALELRQANNIARFNTTQQLQARFNEINAILLTDQSLRELLAKKDTLTADEGERLYVFANFIVNVWISVQEARNDDQIDEDLFLSMINDVEVALERWPKIQGQIDLCLARYPGVEGYQIFDAILRRRNSSGDAKQGAAADAD